MKRNMFVLLFLAFAVLLTAFLAIVTDSFAQENTCSLTIITKLDSEYSQFELNWYEYGTNWQADPIESVGWYPLNQDIVPSPDFHSNWKAEDGFLAWIENGYLVIYGAYPGDNDPIGVGDNGNFTKFEWLGKNELYALKTNGRMISVKLDGEKAVVSLVYEAVSTFALSPNREFVAIVDDVGNLWSSGSVSDLEYGSIIEADVALDQPIIWLGNEAVVYALSGGPLMIHRFLIDEIGMDPVIGLRQAEYPIVFDPESGILYYQTRGNLVESMTSDLQRPPLSYWGKMWFDSLFTDQGLVFGVKGTKVYFVSGETETLIHDTGEQVLGVFCE